MWDVAFAPTTFVDPLQTTDATAFLLATRHLAVATSRVGFPSPTCSVDTLTGTRDVGDDVPHVLGATRAFPNLLQIWAVASPHMGEDDGAAPLMNSPGSHARGHGHGHGRGRHTATLQYCVEMARGAHWQAVWSPLRAAGDALGLLALVCGDGTCAVLQPPRKAGSDGGSGTGGQELAGGRAPVLAMGTVPEGVVRCAGRTVVSAAWSPHDTSLLCCGLDDGSVTLWTVHCGPTGVPEVTLSAVLTDPAGVGRTPAAARAVSFSPYNSPLVLAGGYAANTNVWNINAPTIPCPVFRHVARPGWCHDVQWDPQGNGLYGVYSDVADVLWESPAGSANQARAGQVVPRPLYAHASGAIGAAPAGVWRLATFVADGQTAVVSVSQDGSARLAIPSLLTTATRRSNERRRRRVGGGAVWEPMRVCSVTHREGSDRAVNKGVVDVHVSTGVLRGVASQRHLVAEPSPLGPAAAATALHAVDAAPFDAAGGRHLADARCHLLAYGGAAGLVRVHAVDLKALVMSAL